MLDRQVVAVDKPRGDCHRDAPRIAPALIVARAIQGWGCSGSLGGSVLMISYVVEPKKHQMLIGLWMVVFICSTIVGHLIGGAFTTEVTWRWCFWINLPVGGPVVALVLLFFRMPKHIKPVPVTWKEILLQLDLLGFSLLLNSLVCFTLALQWGGQTKPWNDGSVIATLVMWVVLTIAFFINETVTGQDAASMGTLASAAMPETEQVVERVSATKSETDKEEL